MSKNNNLSEEFKKEITENKKTNYLSIVLALTAIILIFGTVGAAVYQLTINNNQVEHKTSEEKIQSTPSEEIRETPKNEEPKVEPKVEAPKQETYTVVEGDNLGSIATKYSTTVEKLMSDNGITDETALQIGQVLKIIK